MEGGWEALEHTADVGIRATGPDLRSTFAWATRGLLEIVGVWEPADVPERDVELEVEARDLEALLVDWLSEVLYVQDSDDVVVASIELSGPRGTSLSGRLGVAARVRDAEGTQVKAVTYHKVSVTERPEGWVAEVYLDI